MYLSIVSHVIHLEVYTGAATNVMLKVDVENMGVAFSYKIHFTKSVRLLWTVNKMYNF